VKLNSILSVGLVLGAVAMVMRSQTAPPKPAAMATKIAIIAMRDAMVSTLDGKAAGAQMQASLEPERARLQKEGAAIQAADDQLRKAAATMSPEAQRKAAEDLGNRKKKLDRDIEDLNANAEALDNRLMQEITGKMGAVIDGYAKKNGYTVVMDASVPVLWAAESANVTPDIIKAYDAAHPAAAAGAAAKK
jgi:outer membrane protein